MAEVKAAVDDLRADFGDHAYLLFAAGLLLSTGDYDQLMSDAVLDGYDDKKIDLFHLDRDTGRAVVLQAHERADWKDLDPPANKASDLNTASAWLLDAELTGISRPDVRAAAEDLRDALESGDIYEVAFYFLHNSGSSANVQTELSTVRESLVRKLESWAEKANTPILGTARELSISDVLDLYESRHAAITVTDRITIPTLHRAEQVRGEQWRGASVTVAAPVLVELVDRYGEALTSANIRDYLGRRSSSRNINQQIARTAQEEPQNFWVYNNGLTLITRKFTARESSLTCTGLAVTNGAQTLGSLAEIKDRSALDDVQIPIRIIESENPSLIENIIRFNNTQNPIKPWELRVLDRTQMRIEEDFKNELGITYQFRRGASRSSIQNVHLSKLAPWLAAFNGDPIRAHRNSPELFENEKIYRSLFNDESDVHHLLAVYRLGEAVGAIKDQYRSLVREEKASEGQATLYGYFRYGAFTTAVIYLASEVILEVFGGGPNVKNQLRLTPELEASRDDAIEYLRRLVEFTIAPIPSELEDSDAYASLRTEPGIAGLRSRVQVTVRQMSAISDDAMGTLTSGLTVAQ